MARLLGVDIPNEKRIEASLPYIYGIGWVTSRRILDQAGIDPNIRTGQLTDEQLTKLTHVIGSEGIVIEGDLRRDLQANLKRLQQVNCYRGVMHRKGLPTRGQRTKTNGRTRRGGKRTVGVSRNPNAKKGKV
ncbi:MAG: small subunit ribosomal protein S13 [Verrucomicrobiales bacterium]|jgi:small subunit ribosomal protein S13